MPVEQTRRPIYSKVRPRLRRCNLIFFSFLGNECYPKLSQAAPKCVKVNLEKGTWDYADFQYTRTFKIGEHSPDLRHQSVFGVYDMANFRHLESIAHLSASIANANGHGSILDD